MPSGTAHRAEATTYGMGKYAKIACAGPCVASELEALTKALAQPARPMVAIVGDPSFDETNRP